MTAAISFSGQMLRRHLRCTLFSVRGVLRLLIEDFLRYSVRALDGASQLNYLASRYLVTKMTLSLWSVL